MYTVRYTQVYSACNMLIVFPVSSSVDARDATSCVGSVGVTSTEYAARRLDVPRSVGPCCLCFVNVIFRRRNHHPRDEQSLSQISRCVLLFFMRCCRRVPGSTVLRRCRWSPPRHVEHLTVPMLTGSETGPQTRRAANPAPGAAKDTCAP